MVESARDAAAGRHRRRAAPSSARRPPGRRAGARASPATASTPRERDATRSAGRDASARSATAIREPGRQVRADRRHRRRRSPASPSRRTCSRSTPRSRPPAPASRAAASRSSPRRSASSPRSPSRPRRDDRGADRARSRARRQHVVERRRGRRRSAPSDGVATVGRDARGVRAHRRAVEDMAARRQIATRPAIAEADARRDRRGRRVAEQSSASAEQVSASTQQTSASTQEIAASAQELATTAEELDQARRPLQPGIARWHGGPPPPADAASPPCTPRAGIGTPSRPWPSRPELRASRPDRRSGGSRRAGLVAPGDRHGQLVARLEAADVADAHQLALRQPGLGQPGRVEQPVAEGLREHGRGRQVAPVAVDDADVPARDDAQRPHRRVAQPAADDVVGRQRRVGEGDDAARPSQRTGVVAGAVAAGRDAHDEQAGPERERGQQRGEGAAPHDGSCGVLNQSQPGGRSRSSSGSHCEHSPGRRSSPGRRAGASCAPGSRAARADLRVAGAAAGAGVAVKQLPLPSPSHQKSLPLGDARRRARSPSGC